MKTILRMLALKLMFLASAFAGSGGTPPPQNLVTDPIICLSMCTTFVNSIAEQQVCNACFANIPGLSQSCTLCSFCANKYSSGGNDWGWGDHCDNYENKCKQIEPHASDAKCNQYNTPQQGTAPTVKDIIIKDAWYGPDETKVHLKVAGKGFGLTIFAKDSNNSINSGVDYITCYVNGKPFNGTPDFNISNGRSMKVQVDATPHPVSKENNEIRCVGSDKQGNLLQGTTTFATVPAKYQFTKVDMTFTRAIGSNPPVTPVPFYKNNIPIDSNNAISFQVASNGELGSNGQHLQEQYKPIIEVDSPLNIRASIKRLNDTNSLDNGPLASTMQVMSGTITYTAPNKDSCGYNQLQVGQATAGDGRFNNGVLAISGSQGTIARITPTDAYKPQSITLKITDVTMKNFITRQQTAGNCKTYGYDTSNGPACPFPPEVTLHFTFQSVPNNFRVQIVKNDNSDANVLYYGQGNTPLAEANSNNKVIVTAIKSNGDALQYFTKDCAAQDVDLELNTNAGINIELKDPVTGSISKTIPSTDFTNYTADGGLNSQARPQKIISVNLADNATPPNSILFTPSMEKEPLFIGASNFIGRTYFTKYDPLTIKTYYPNYNNLVFANGEIVILRGRINAIDTDNAATTQTDAQGNAIKTNPIMKVYHEFRCNFCDLAHVFRVANPNMSVPNPIYPPSPTQQGWFVDTHFLNHNQVRLETNKIISPDLNGLISKVDSNNLANGFYNINFNNAPFGRYKVQIQHGNNANMMPAFLLHQPYWTNIGPNNLYGYTNAYVSFRDNAAQNTSDYGIDTKAGRNTRSSGRTGAY